ncbi:hypothetical protein GIB67_000639, partial [Kingdonia uniflora]
NWNYDSRSNDRTPPWNFGPRVQVVRTTLNLIRTTVVKTSIYPRSSKIIISNLALIITSIKTLRNSYA